MRGKNGFSLMEMMIVLLIMSIIAAATAPIVSKKMAQSSKLSVSPWVFTGEGKNIAYNMGGLDNATAIIGAAKVPDGTNTRLYIDCGSNASQITLGKDDEAANIVADPVGKRVGIFSKANGGNVLDNSVVIGMGLSGTGDNSIVIGHSATGNDGSVIIGNNAESSAQNATAIGYNAQAAKESTAIGYNSFIEWQNSTAIGSNTSIESPHSTAIGSNTSIESSHSTAIGSNISIAKNAEYSTAIGNNISIPTAVEKSTAIGYNAKVGCSGSIAIGTEATAKNSNGTGFGAPIAIGEYTSATKTASIAIGSKIATGNSTEANKETKATGHASTAIGGGAQALGNYSTAIGVNAIANNNNSTAIGYGATSTASNQIVLGTKDDTVYIPGNLVVGRSTYLGARMESAGSDSHLYVKFHKMVRICETSGENNDLYHNDIEYTVPYSDKRLKNIGDKFTAGVNELKKLDFYHYTFKNDKNKTPHVGVIAQDLQNVFPDAVTKGGDGYLRIRFEDMFFAVINAIKELDEKISNIIAKNDEQDKSIGAQKQSIETLQTTVKTQQELIDAQQKTIEELQKQLINQNEEFSKRLKKLEGREG